MPLYFSGRLDIWKHFRRELFGFAIAVGMLITAQLTSARAQTAQLEATVSATSGAATIIKGTARLSVPVQKGEKLTPGDEIETGPMSRVTLKLTDGSLVTIHPNSHVVIKDFRDAPSVRELVRVLAGYVRVKIYHAGKRLNPYRVNTPVASIAVRGTDFSVRVTATGETRVTVFEGLVEVSSQTNPGQKRLLSPSRSVVVRPSGDIGLLAPGAGSELNAIANWFNQPSGLVDSSARNYSENITSPASSTSFERFLAFADSHFDSQENPAYATQFSEPDGRIYLLPSFSALQRNTDDGIGPGIVDSKLDYYSYSVADQNSYFIPITGTRIVVGGILTLVRTQLHSNDRHTLIPSDPRYFYIPSDIARLVNENARLNLTTINGSLIAARKFGTSQRTSLGLQFDQLIGQSETELKYSQSTEGGFITNYRAIVEDQVRRSRVTVGLARDFTEGKKLGVFYRYGIATTNRRQSALFQRNHSFTSYESLFQSSEIGARWRSPLTRRLYYGIHGAVIFNRARLNLHSPIPVERIYRRAVFGGGIGYEIRPQTTVAFDVAGGAFRRTHDYDNKDGRDLLVSTRTKSRFLTLHVGGQTDLGRRFFVNGSLFWERNRRREESFSATNYSTGIFTDWREFLNLGPGWRIRQNIDAQYIFSWSSSSETNSHSLMLRYNFGSGEK